MKDLELIAVILQFRITAGILVADLLLAFVTHLTHSLTRDSGSRTLGMVTFENDVCWQRSNLRNVVRRVHS